MVTINTIDQNYGRQCCSNSKTSKANQGTSFKGYYSYGYPYYGSNADDIIENKENAKDTLFLMKHPEFKKENHNSLAGLLVGGITTIAGLLLSKSFKKEGGKMVVDQMSAGISVMVGTIAGVLTWAAMVENSKSNFRKQRYMYEMVQGKTNI